jgi:hypothetical protein
VLSEAGAKVCSFACADRMTARAKVGAEENKLEGWGTRIWTSAFLLLLLTLGGGLLAGFLSFTPANLWFQQNNPDFESYLNWRVLCGALGGTSAALGFLHRYYTRRKE